MKNDHCLNEPWASQALQQRGLSAILCDHSKWGKNFVFYETKSLFGLFKHLISVCFMTSRCFYLISMKTQLAQPAHFEDACIGCYAVMSAKFFACMIDSHGNIFTISNTFAS